MLEAENLISVQLGKNSTLADFVIQFLNKIRIGRTERVGLSVSLVSAHYSAPLMHGCAKCGKTFPSDEHESLCSDCR